jgi:hypothetical protein
MKSFISYLLPRMVVTFAAVILFILISGQNVQAAAFSGSAANFSWANGFSTNGLFGAPTLSGDQTSLIFTPSNFRADSVDGEFSSVDDTLVFELTAQNGFSFNALLIEEHGDYAFQSGSGTVDVDGLLTIENMDETGSYNANLITTPDMPQSGSNSDALPWSAEAQINLNSLTHIKITLLNELTAQSNADGDYTFIEKKGLGDTISIQIIPEPATIGLLILGSLVFLGKKK